VSQGRFLQGGLTCVGYEISVGNFLSQDMMYVLKSSVATVAIGWMVVAVMVVVVVVVMVWVFRWWSGMVQLRDVN
jgi:hypothetical protein